MIADPIPWRELAACQFTNPDAFFPAAGGSVDAVRAICQGCEVRDSCLADVMDWERRNAWHRHGLVGGLTANERRKLAKGLAA